VFQDAFLAALDGRRPGNAVIVLTWLHRAEREVLRGPFARRSREPERGVFTTRSADRPNPVGRHEVEVVAVEAPPACSSGPLEAVDGAPVLDLEAGGPPAWLPPRSRSATS
jgi:L-fuculose-phosphate aldolase